ncbi:PREDICTED: venom allergen 5-like [Nicrophorus vespilloides]|uniref:Venom allergen 5-like n=1 Tax=Nicrophorus vespilloides TaxID=110193 RepID=A0ABM1M3M6_NICVS|nr:PREDICTED: venom allergen 5-like [Nicrophorus vespilloides]
MEERECILDEHNLYRDKMARGEFSNHFLPKTSNMHVLSYDKEAEFIAGCYIKQCIWGHDKTRLTVKGRNLGQNLYSYSVSVERNTLNCKLLRTSLDGWVNNELKFLNESNAASWGERYTFLYEAGHLTQVLWSNTKYVGCAMLHSRRNGKAFHVYDVFCDYLPPGNYRNKAMYKKGEPATDCAPLKANDRYKHLCGPIRPISEDTYIPPTDAPGDMQFSEDNVNSFKCTPFLIFTIIINILFIL